MSLERLKPRFVEKVWGAEQLQPWFPNSASKVGEVWFERPELPLLAKFLFTSANLSVQVHPDDDYAGRHHASRGKTEMWHVLAAQPGARIAAGFREPISAARLREAALTGEIETLLAWYEAAAGDTFFIPAGTVHAIGGGLTLCEIQQHSDVTYRLYDYGRPRELHLDRAAAVSRLEPYPARVDARGETLVACRHFTVARRRVNGAAEFAPPARNSSLLMITEGAGEFAGNSVSAGEVWYAPAGASPFGVSGSLTLLWASNGETASSGASRAR